MSGNIAFPQRPMIIIEAPSLVNLPKPSKANGHIPAHIRELGNPGNKTNHMDMSVVCPKIFTEMFVFRLPIQLKRFFSLNDVLDMCHVNWRMFCQESKF